jgi:hypothetical protein
VTAIVGRLRQGVRALRPAPDPDEAAYLVRFLDAPQRAAFLALAVHDRAHLVRVARAATRARPDDREFIVAAFLHDLGKAGPPGRVRLVDRVANVLLARFAPGLRQRLGRLPAPRWRAGFAACVHHSAIGADHARRLGCSDRVVALIAAHEQRPVPADPDLRLIAAIDDRDGDPPDATPSPAIA